MAILSYESGSLSLNQRILEAVYPGKTWLPIRLIQASIPPNADMIESHSLVVDVSYQSFTGARISCESLNGTKPCRCLDTIIAQTFFRISGQFGEALFEGPLPSTQSSVRLCPHLSAAYPRVKRQLPRRLFFTGVDHSFHALSAYVDSQDNAHE